MKYKRQESLLTQPETSKLSKTKTMFVEGSSAKRAPLSARDVLVCGDVVGACGYLLAKGHTKRIYGIIADVTLS